MNRITTSLTCLLTLCISVCAMAGPSLHVTAQQYATTIVRQSERGKERCVYLAIHNDGPDEVLGASMRLSLAGKTTVRAMLQIPPGDSTDTVWIPEPTTTVLHADVRATDGAVLWSGTLSVKPSGRIVTIPFSRAATARQLKPLMLRGTNYYPRSQPWAGMWNAMDQDQFEAEFKQMDTLNINCLRTFYIFDAEHGLHTKDGAFTPTMISRIDTLLQVANRHHTKVMICLVGGGGNPMSDLNWWRRYLRTGLEPFAHDGRVLMWDLINEPGGNDGPKANADLSRWLQAMYPELKAYAPNHLATVGLCWQFDQLWDLGVKPDVGQYHDYSGAVGVQPEGQPKVRNIAEDLRNITTKYTATRPLLIGEFGLYSQTGDEKTDEQRAAALNHQADIYRWVLQGAEAQKIAGVFSWCAFQFTPDWMGRKEQTFGVILPDGTLKPAGVILRDTFARWRKLAKAPWE